MPWASDGRTRLLGVVLGLVLLVLLMSAPRAEAVPSVTYKCTPAPQDCSGWYRSNVLIDWTVLPSGSAVTGCQDKTYTTDTTGTNEFCSADDGTATVTVQLKIKVDKTAPVVTGGSPPRGADESGWYNHPVAISFAGNDQTSGIDSCSAPTYSGPDSSAAALSGTCRDKAGNVSLPFPYGLKYDETDPSVDGAVPERSPNAAGWFNRAVAFAVQGSDATSGVASCPSVTYAGPDSPTASFTGTCRDRAGNSAGRSFGLRYDATAPEVADLRVAAGDRRLALSWQATPDVESVEVVRTPGAASAEPSVVFGGPGTSFEDVRVQNGVRYAYQVTVRDGAGNGGSQTVTGVPVAAQATTATSGGALGKSAKRRARRLIAPPLGGIVKAGHPPLLRWKAIKRARYYNVQLFRSGRKLLSAWPTGPRYKLKKTWSYAGGSHRLTPGRYRWIVWPGFGPRARANYGKAIGRSMFVVKRRKP